jgi:putative transcriptional regulator
MTWATGTTIARRNFAALFACAAAFAAMSLPATLSIAALPTPSQAPGPTSLTGQLLIASPSMGDPRFYHAVIVMVQHGPTGALGIMINRLLGERSMASVLKAVGENDSGATGRVRIFIGGPVQTDAGFVLHSADYHRDDTVGIDGHMSMTSSREILRDIADHKGPKKSLIAFGYAGWGPGQLEGELQQRGWYTAEADENIVFDDDRDKVWDDAVKRRTQDL